MPGLRLLRERFLLTEQAPGVLRGELPYPYVPLQE